MASEQGRAQWGWQAGLSITSSGLCQDQPQHGAFLCQHSAWSAKRPVANGEVRPTDYERMGTLFTYSPALRFPTSILPGAVHQRLLDFCRCQQPIRGRVEGCSVWGSCNTVLQPHLVR